VLQGVLTLQPAWFITAGCGHPAAHANNPAITDFPITAGFELIYKLNKPV